MLPAWFMWMQVVSCLIAASMTAVSTKNYAMAWTWFCYGLANLGFVKMAGGF